MIGETHDPAETQAMLREQLSAALKGATDSDDGRAIGILRLIQAVLKERDLRGQADGLADAELIALLQAMVDQRRESIRRYEESGQLELAQREAEEIEVIQRFLPPQLDEAACAQAVNQVIADLGACKLKDTGRVMTELKSRYPGQMNFAKARRMVCQQLG
jgi:uncharacterized protein YqeY